MLHSQSNSLRLCIYEYKNTSENIYYIFSSLFSFVVALNESTHFRSNEFIRYSSLCVCVYWIKKNLQLVTFSILFYIFSRPRYYYKPRWMNITAYYYYYYKSSTWSSFGFCRGSKDGSSSVLEQQLWHRVQCNCKLKIGWIQSRYSLLLLLQYNTTRVVARGTG